MIKILCASMSAFIMASATAGSPRLTVGDPAPRLEVMEWVKGPPVREFEKGKIYVVDLWALWCGSCILAMPHLSDLARQYRDEVTFISVHTETEAGRLQATPRYLERIRKLVAEKGRDLDFATAIDDPATSPIGRDWYASAKLAGLPGTFIVDRAGKIAAINPTNLDRAIAQTVDGTLDADASKAQSESNARAEEDLDRQWNAITGPVRDALARKDYGAALAAANRALTDKSAPFSNLLLQWRLQAWLHVNEAEALIEAHRLLKDEEFVKISDSPAIYGGMNAATNVGTVIVQEDGLAQETYRFGVDCLEQAVKNYPDGVGGWSRLALGYKRLGEADKAGQMKRKTIAVADKIGLSGTVTGERLQEDLDRVAELRPRF
jgi:thiol-disulfide isomerase/thioredoxin